MFSSFPLTDKERKDLFLFPLVSTRSEEVRLLAVRRKLEDLLFLTNRRNKVTTLRRVVDDRSRMQQIVSEELLTPF